MEQKINELLKEAFRLMGEDSDIIIIAHKGKQCASVLHSSTDNIAKSVFSFIHQPENKIGQSLYRILRLNVLNMVSNGTAFANDLIDSINDLIDSKTKDENDTEL